MSDAPLIVVLDSDDPYIEMIGECLRDETYQTIAVTRGGDPSTVIAQRLPQLVIIELHGMTPGVGPSVLNRMRLNPSTRHIPVIIASTATDLIARNAAHLHSKGCAILLKPFDLDDLLAEVRHCIPAA